MSVWDNGKAVGALTLVGGAMIGAGIALLYAPQSGERTRREISLNARKTGRQVRRAARDLSDGVNDLIDGLEHAAGDWRAKGKEIVHDARRGLRDTLEACEDVMHQRKERTADGRG